MATIAQLNDLAAREQDKVNSLSNAIGMLSSNIQFAKSNEAVNQDPNPYLSPVAAAYLASKTKWVPELNNDKKKLKHDENMVNAYRAEAQQQQENQEQSEEGWSLFFSALGIFLMVLAM